MFTRLVVLLELGADPGAVAGLLTRFAPRPERLHVLAYLPGPSIFTLWQDPDGPRIPEQLAELSAALRDSTGIPDPPVELVSNLELEHLAVTLAEIGAEAVLVWRPASTGDRKLMSIVDRIVERHRVPVLLGAPGMATPAGSGRHFLCGADRACAGLDQALAFLAPTARPTDRVTILALDAPDARQAVDREERAALSGLRAQITPASRPDADLHDRTINRYAEAHGVDLVVIAVDLASALGLAGTRLCGEARVPILFLPLAAKDPGRFAFTLDAPDLLYLGGPTLTVRAEGLNLVGHPVSLPSTPITIVANGDALATVDLIDGRASIPVTEAFRSQPPPVLGLARGTHVETTVAVVTPGARRVRLFDADLDPDALHALVEVLGTDPDGAPALLLGVRLDDNRSCRALQQRLLAAGVSPAPVVDGSEILDDGRPSDVPAGMGFVRLARVAARMRSEGARVDAIVHRYKRALPDRGFACLPETELLATPGAELRQRVEGAWRPPLAGLEELTQSRATVGNLVEFHSDNQGARGRVLALFDGARERIHLQSYMIHDDATVRMFEQALISAAARGVRVRIVVDSLYGRHGSLGRTNALLARLERLPNVEVRAYRPILSVPGFEELKQRNHRKLMVVDGEIAVVSGRNLGAAYYTGFPEVAISPASALGDLPWLDASAELRGPAVHAVEQGFHDVWVTDGGDDYPVARPTPATAGPASVRVVLHTGYSDANGLEAYLALIGGARRSVTLVNSFAIQFELIHALLGALRRGVRVRALFGNPCPLYGDDIPFSGQNAGVLELYSRVVLGRIDTLATAGAEAWEFGLRALPHWDAALGVVRPYVHAKLMLVDGETFAVGSENLDICASYWESEALVVVEDRDLAARVEASIEAALSHSIRVDPNDPRWRERARRRAWLSQHWPSQVW